MIRLLLWHWNRKGGGPRYTYELARALAERDDVAVSLSYARQSEFAAPMAALGLPELVVDTYRSVSGFAAGFLRLPGLRRELVDFARAQGADVVISTMTHLWSPLVAPGLTQAGIPYVLVAHDAEPHPGENNVIRRWVTARDIALADALVGPTTHVAAGIARQRPDLPAARIATIPLGSFAFGPAPTAPRTLPPGGPITLTFFGRLLAYKGIDILADAYARLHDRFGDRIRLVVAGAGDEAMYGPMLRPLPGATWDNRWIAEEEVEGLLADADILLLPYREASQSGSLAAAEHAGLPAVATPVGGLAEEIRRYGSGIVADAVTAEAFAEAVAHVILDDSAYASAAAAALATAAGPKSWSRVAKDISGFARSIARHGRDIAAG